MWGIEGRWVWCLRLQHAGNKQALRKNNQTTCQSQSLLILLHDLRANKSPHTVHHRYALADFAGVSSGSDSLLRRSNDSQNRLRLTRFSDKYSPSILSTNEPPRSTDAHPIHDHLRSEFYHASWGGDRCTVGLRPARHPSRSFGGDKRWYFTGRVSLLCWICLAECVPTSIRSKRSREKRGSNRLQKKRRGLPHARHCRGPGRTKALNCAFPVCNEI